MECRPLSPETWGAYERLIDDHGGIFGGCWCLVFHKDTKGGSYEERRARKRAMVDAGVTHAALVFDGAACIGWLQYGRAGELTEIRNRKAYEAGRGDEALPDWRLTCFFIAKGRRKQGVAAVALAGALEQIAEAGGGVVEAYPERLEGQKTSASFLWGGTTGLFERAGFGEVRQIGLHKWVYRRQVAPG